MKPQMSILAIAILVCGCIYLNDAKAIDTSSNQQASPEATAIQKCKDLCNQQLAAGADLSKGPCLSNEIEPDWVCDVAHNPREAVDDDPANQCPAFREGMAHHFVELCQECSRIKSQ